MTKKILLILFLLTLSLGLQANEGSTQSNIDSLYNSFSKKYEKVRVERVIKADLIELESGEKIQLIGLNAPEPPEDMYERYTRTEVGLVIEKRAEDPRFSNEESSYIFAVELLTDKEIRLEFDVEKSSDDYHTLAYVFLLEDDTFVNTEILKQGYAHLRITPPNMKYAKELRKAYQDARKNFRGFQGEY